MPSSQEMASLRTDGTNAFAHHSMAVRIPGIIDQVIERNADYAGALKDNLRRLRDEIAGNAPLRIVEPPAPDAAIWRERFAPHAGESWLDTEWFFAEMLSYRRMMEAVRYWATLRDPFAPFKEEELGSAALWRVLDQVQALEGSPEERIAAALRFTLWGNRIDLSLASVADKGTEARDEHLLADDAGSVAELLVRGEPGIVHVIMDNAGTEQACDFALVDLLLELGVARRVVLHVKMHPVLVSDVIAADVGSMLAAMHERGYDVATRLRQRIYDGTLKVVPHFFWNTDGRMWEIPAALGLDGASLVIAKGDVNYRRATNDAIWPASATLDDAVGRPGEALGGAALTSHADAGGRFPTPLVVLRTLKSDTLVGVPAEVQERLDAAEPDWRTNGTYGVIQCTAS